MRASEIRELLKLLDEPGIISFAGGIPDPALFPVEEARDAFAAALSDASAGHALQYSVSEGSLPLRQWIVGHMGRLGVPCEPDNILITAGSQQALDFLGRVLLSPGDTALVTAPTYLGALQAFSAYEPRYDELRPEHGNRTPEAYRRCRRRERRRGEIRLRGARLRQSHRRDHLARRAAIACSISSSSWTSRSSRTRPTAALRFEGDAAAVPAGARRRARRQHRWLACDLLRHLLQDHLARLAHRLDLRRQVYDPSPCAHQADVGSQQRHHQSDGHAPPCRGDIRAPGDNGPRALSPAPRRHAGGTRRSICPRA